MKARTLIIMTGAILALTASAAQANLTRTLPTNQTFALHHKVVTHKKVVAQKVTKKQSTGPRYIYIPGPVGQPSTPADDCPYSGNNCTDEQLCDIWGMNCDLLVISPSPTTVAAPTESAPAASSTDTAPSTDAAPAESSTTSTSNDSSTLCPSGGLWDYEYQYCH